jgi:hypothetical protein
MFAYGGSVACGSGGFADDTWTFDLKTKQWQRMHEHHPYLGYSIVASAYDPVTKKVYVRNQSSFHAYDYDTNTWERLSSDDYLSGFGTASAVIDPIRRKFVIVGPSSSVYTIDLGPNSDYRVKPVSTSGALTLLNEKRSPGLAYDPVRDRIVAWDGSDIGSTPDTVYSLDLESGVWAAVQATGGPAGGNTRGTFGRWQYVPSHDAFVVVNSASENIFLWRFNGDTPPEPDVVSPKSPSNVGVE